LREAIQSRGIEEVRRLIRTHTDQVFQMGWIEIIEQVPSDVQVS
jgi:hypothetical protein